MNSEFRRRTQIKDVSSAVQEIKWVRYIVRQHQNYWAQAATVWDSRSGSGKRGRTATSWMGDMKKQAGNIRGKTARNRDDRKKYWYIKC